MSHRWHCCYMLACDKESLWSRINSLLVLCILNMPIICLVVISKSYSLFITIFVISIFLYFPFPCGLLTNYFKYMKPNLFFLTNPYCHLFISIFSILCHFLQWFQFYYSISCYLSYPLFPLLSHSSPSFFFSQIKLQILHIIGWELTVEIYNVIFSL